MHRFSFEMKKFSLLAAFIVVISLINAGINFIVLGATEPHRLQNHELYSHKNEYEIIGLGPSDCMSHFDAPEATALLGEKCFNYGQAGTSYTVGAVKSSFENVLSCQSPKKILFFVSHDNLYKDLDSQESSKTFIHATSGMTNKIAKAKYYLKASENDGAIERIFQWKYILGEEEMPSLTEMKENAENKLSSGYKKYNIEWRNSIQDSTIYVEDGFVARATNSHYDSSDEPDYDVNLTGYNKNLEINPDEVDGHDLDTMIDICKKKGIDAYVLMGPLSPELICEEGALYEEKSKTLAAIAKKNDVPYLDLNYIKKEYYRPEYDEWADDKHLDIEGAKRYTQALCMVLSDVFEGRKTDQYFYTNLREMLESYDNVAIISE